MDIVRPQLNGELPEGFLATDLRVDPSGVQGHRDADQVLELEGLVMERELSEWMRNMRQRGRRDYVPVFHRPSEAGVSGMDLLEDGGKKLVEEIIRGERPEHPLARRLLERVAALGYSQSIKVSRNRSFASPADARKAVEDMFVQTGWLQAANASSVWSYPLSDPRRGGSGTDLVSSSFVQFAAQHAEALLGYDLSLKGPDQAVYAVYSKGNREVVGVFMASKDWDPIRFEDSNYVCVRSVEVPPSEVV